MINTHLELQDSIDISTSILIIIKLNSKVQRNVYFYFITINLNSMWKPRCALLRVKSIVIASPTSFPVAEWFSKYNHKGQTSFPWNFILKWASWGPTGKPRQWKAAFKVHTHVYWNTFHFFLCDIFALPPQHEFLQVDHYVEFYHHGRNFRDLVKTSYHAWLDYEN